MKVGGIIIFADYGWRNPNNSEKNPQKGIDLFLNSINDKWEVVAHYPRGFQLIIRKIAKSKEEEEAEAAEAAKVVVEKSVTVQEQ